MSAHNTRKYRGISIYLKPGKKTLTKDEGQMTAGEINYGARRAFVPQQDTVEKMMRKARRMIDKELDEKVDVVDKWFRTPLV